MLKFNIDAKQIAEAFGDLKEQVEQELTNSVKGLASMTHAKTAELANEGLKTTRKKYLSALSFSEIGNGIWVVSLDKSAMFIEEDISQYDMRDTMLKKGYKTSKSGYKYRSIPFNHDTNPSDSSSFQNGLMDRIKQELVQRGIPSGIEKDENGSPRIGTLHKFNVNSPFPSPTASHPALHGVTIIQSMGEDGNVRRDTLTFRVISENPETQGKWIREATEGKKFMNKAFEESERVWETEVLPAIMEKFK